MPAPKPLPEGLLDAVRDTPHMGAFIERMRFPDTKTERKRLRQLFRRRGIDASHWCYTPKRLCPDDVLQAAVAASTSYRGVMRLLGISPAGGRTTTFRGASAPAASTRPTSSARRTAAASRRLR